MKKIDIHCHTTKRRLSETIDEYARVSDIEMLMEKHDIEKTVILSTYFPHKASGVSNYRLLKWIEGNKKFMMFGSLDFEHYFMQGYSELEELAEEKKIAGIKIYTGYQNIDLFGKNFKRVIDLAKETSLPVMFHVGYTFSTRSTLGTPYAAAMVSPTMLESALRGYDDINFIFCHLGKPFIDEIIEVTSRNHNIYSDMSGLIDSKTESHELDIASAETKRVLENVGSHKILFGTDFPVQTHEHTLYILEHALQGFSEKEKENVYYKNAEKLLSLQ